MLKSLKNHFRLAMILVMFVSVLVFLQSSKAEAACTAPSTDYGTVTASIDITASGTYRVWSRIQIPSNTNDNFLLEIDNGTCYTVNDTAIANNTWTWVDYSTGGTKISPTLSVGTHQIKLIGTSQGVLVDRLIFTQDTTSANCNPPTGTGDACASSTSSDTTAPTVNITSPIANSRVNGIVNVVASASDVDDAVSKGELYIDGTLKNTITSAGPFSFNWDASALTPATSHTIMVKAYDSASPNNVGSTSSTVAIRKPGDCDNNNLVNSSDLAAFSFGYGKPGQGFNGGDFNNDNKVDSNDVALFSYWWGK